MADQKLTALSALSALTGDDLLYVVDDVAGTPTSYKVTAAVARNFTNMAQATGTDANTTMAVNTLYVVDMSAWATADRTYTLPAVAAVGDQIAIKITAGDASHELIITAGSGDTLEGIAGGTEWSRLFITNESVLMRCTVANTTWVIAPGGDGRIPQKAMMSLTTNATGETAATFVRPTAFSGAWTAQTDNASLTSTSGDQIKTRRAGTFDFAFFGFSVSALTAGEYFSVALYKNGTTNILAASSLQTPTGATIGQQAGGHVENYALVADDYVVYQYRSLPGSKGLLSAAMPRVISWFTLTEKL